MKLHSRTTCMLLAATLALPILGCGQERSAARPGLEDTSQGSGVASANGGLQETPGQIEQHPSGNGNGQSTRSQVSGNGAGHVSSSVRRIADNIVQNVGEVRQTNEGTAGPVFVFEEYHTSRIGQLQIAVMLLRLQQRHNLGFIGLEGSLQRDGPLDASWFHSLGGADGEQVREDVAVRMLGEGEISAPEFVAAVFPDIRVYGLERAPEYNQTLDVEGSPEGVYLLKIAEKSVSPADIREINRLANSGKAEEAVEYLMKKVDPWVRKQYEALQKPGSSLEETARRAREIRDKARNLSVTVPPSARQDLQKALRFYEVGAKRSNTMTDRMVELLRSHADEPAAMVIGAAHSEKIVKLFEDADVSFGLLRPIALNPEHGNLSFEQFERKNDKKWARTSEGTLGRLLNAERKPPSMFNTPTAKSYASWQFAAILVAEAARGGKRVPEDIRSLLEKLPECQIAWDSFEIDGNDVTFQMRLTQTDGTERAVWTRVGTLDTEEQANSLEDKLLQQIADLQGGGQAPPRDPPANSKRTVSPHSAN